MVYDPCAPHSPAAAVARAGHAVHRHHVHRLIGRRIARWHGPAAASDACPKVARAVLPNRIARVFDPLVVPGVLTVTAMAVVGATAFSGVTTIRQTTAGLPVQTKGKEAGTPGTGAPGTTGTGIPGTGLPGTTVPEPGTAAILAIAMVVVLISSWVQGGRALRAQPQSDIASSPLPNRRLAPAGATRNDGLQEPASTRKEA